jgi:hypothetical protein
VTHPACDGSWVHLIEEYARHNDHAGRDPAAVLAIELYHAFPEHDDETDRSVVVEPGPEVIRAVLTSRRSPMNAGSRQNR